MLSEIILKIAEQFQEKEETVYYPRPSLAGKERCTRQMVYHGLNYPHDPLAGRAVMIFSDSSFHEDLTADWIRKSAYQLHSEQMEVAVDMGFNFKLKGHIDGIVTDLMGVDYLWEHKAVNHFSWQKYWDGSIPYDYVSQCCIYLRGLHSDNPNIQKASLLIKNKNTAAYMEFIIFYNYDQDVAVVETATNSNGEVKEINETIPNAVKSCFEKFAYVNECIKNKTLPKRDYFIGDDWHCINPYTLVKTDRGWKEAYQIGQGDYVATADGSYQRVNATRHIQSDKKMYEVKGYNLLPIKVTEDHKFLIEEAADGCGNNKGILKWMTAKEIYNKTGKKNRLVFAFDRNQDILNDLNKEQLTLLGFYISEGCKGNTQNGKSYRVQFTFHAKERNYVERLRLATKKLFNINIMQKLVTDKRTGSKYLTATINSRNVVSFIEKHINSGLAHEKSFKEHILRLPTDSLKYLLDTMICGDGCELMTRNSKTIVYSTTSKILALQVQEMYFKQGMIAGIVTNKPSLNSFGNKNIYHVRSYPKAKYNYGRIEDNVFYSPIQYIKPYNKINELETVVDISVPNGNNFLTEGGVVHNCDYCAYGKTCWEGYKKEFTELKTDTMLPDEVETMIRYYSELGAQKKDIESEYKDLSQKIKDTLKTAGAREGRAGGYIVKLSLIESNRIDKEKLTPAEIERAMVKSISERLYVSALKEKGEKNVSI